MKQLLLEQIQKKPEVLTYLFYDGVKTAKKTCQDVENTEPGYFNALFTTFIRQLKSIDTHSNLNVDFIKNLRQQCIAGVEFDLFYSTLEEEQISQKDFLKGQFFGFNLENIASEQLKKQSITELKNDPDRYCETNTNGFFKYSGNGIINAALDNDVAVAIILDDYNKELKEDQTANDKLKTIIKLVQRLERLHPCPDANCRTFCMMLLNLELVKNGMSPVL